MPKFEGDCPYCDLTIRAMSKNMVQKARYDHMKHRHDLKLMWHNDTPDVKEL